MAIRTVYFNIHNFDAQDVIRYLNKESSSIFLKPVNLKRGEVSALLFREDLVTQFQGILLKK